MLTHVSIRSILLTALGLAAVCAGGIVGLRWLTRDLDGGPQPTLGMLLSAVGGSLALYVTVFVIVGIVGARNERVLSRYRLSRFTISGASTLVRHERPVQYRGLRRPLIGDEQVTDSIDLAAVRYFTWGLPIWSLSPSYEVQFWDGDPEPELVTPGVLASPTDPDAALLGAYDVADLAASPEAYGTVITYMQAREHAGLVTVRVDSDAELGVVPDHV